MQLATNGSLVGWGLTALSAEAGHGSSICLYRYNAAATTITSLLYYNKEFKYY